MSEPAGYEAVSSEQVADEQARERSGECENCDSRGSMFRLPTGHDFCFDCTQVYISWEIEGGRVDDPEMFAWLWQDDDPEPKDATQNDDGSGAED